MLWIGISDFFGALLQLIGVVVTGRGAVQTWNEYRPDDALFQKDKDRFARVGRSIQRFLRRLFRRPGPGQTITIGTAEENERVGTPTHTAGMLPIRAVPGSARHADELAQRVVTLYERVNGHYVEVTSHIREVNGRVDDLGTDIDAEARKRRAEIRLGMTDGVRVVVIGLLVTGVGIVAQLVSIVGDLVTGG